MAKRSSQRRYKAALVALLLWVFGFEIVPSVHIGFHELFGHHHHGGHHSLGGGHGKGTHSHPAEEHTEQGPHEKGTEDDGDPNHEHGTHGAGSLEHRGVAVLGGTPPALVLPVSSVEILPQLPLRETRISSNRPRTIRLRGPPSSWGS